MAVNFPGPYEVRFYYSTNYSVGGVLTHSQRLNVRLAADPAPGTAFADIDVLRRDDSPFALSDEVDDWITAVVPMYSNGAGNTWDYAELWKYEAESYDASFISTYPIAAAGTSVTVIRQCSQAIVTFRTMAGGIFKLSFMETVVAEGAKDTLPFSNATLDAIADAVVAGTFPWYGKDNSYPFACIAAYNGTNEAIFKKRFRS
jgi:hypothetical protein